MSSWSGWIVATMSRIGPGPRPLDLLDQDPAGRRRGRRREPGGRPGAGREVLVLVGGQLPAGEPEPAPEGQPHRLGGAGPVERPGHRGPPVDHDRPPVRIVHVPPADVELLAGHRLGGTPGVAAGTRAASLRHVSASLRPGARGVVEPAEEQRRVRQVDQRLGAVVQVGLEVLLGDRVAAHRAQREHVLAHEPQELARAAQVIPFGDQNGIVAAGVLSPSLVAGRAGTSGSRGAIGRGHDCSPPWGKGRASPSGRPGRDSG